MKDQKEYRQRAQSVTLTAPLPWAGIELPNRLQLAPMAGPGGLAFRRICEDWGAGLTITELVSARAIVYDPYFDHNARYLDISSLQSPAAIQLFAFDPDDLRQAIPRLLQHPLYGQTAFIDLNMGCPVKKVVKTGAGSALMRTPDLAARLVETAVEAARPFGKQITVKFRSGWDQDHINAPSFAKLLQEAGASALALHGRTREQMYTGQADWEIIGETATQVQIPLAANGDIQSWQDCQVLLKTYKADACMIGRAALGRPWLFAEILAQDQGIDFQAPEGQEWADHILRHYQLSAQSLGPEMAMREFRTSLSYYFKGLREAAHFRRALSDLRTLQDLEILVAGVVQANTLD